MSDADLRERICEIGASLFRRGLTFGSTGNISVRRPGGGWLMTPTNACLGDLDPAKLSRLDEGGALVSGAAPTKEAFLHRVMYGARQDAQAVVHLHSTHSVAVSCLQGLDPCDCLPPLTAYYVMRVGRLPLVPYHPPGDEGLAHAVAALAGRHHAVLLANHGPVVAGTTLDTAVYAIEELEETARIALLLHGRPTRALTRLEVDDLHARFDRPGRDIDVARPTDIPLPGTPRPLPTLSHAAALRDVRSQLAAQRITMFQSINPATGERIAAYPELTTAELDAKLDKAITAYRGWRVVGISERAALLERIAGQYEANRERLARTAAREMGKTYVSALAEVDKCAAAFRYYAEKGPAMLEPKRIALAGGGSAEIRYLPQGPVLAVMPWNFPFWQAVRFLAPTLLAGNVGLLKHASLVQGVAGLMEEMVAAAGAPDGVFQNLAVKSSAVAAVIADARVVAVTLTGSEGAGRAVAEQAGKALKKVVLELGGSDPFVVMPSADLDAAVAQAVKARIQNTGQSCICGKRMIVHAEVYDAFLERFSAAMRAVKAGDPMDPGSDMGPLSSIEQRDTVLAQLEEAKRQGARLLFGGEALPGEGAYMSAGVLTEVALDSPFMAEELFGPIAMVFRAADIDEAIRIANDIPYGLGSSVWTRDPQEQERFVRDIEAGMTAINQMLASSPEAPFGGVKASGYGRELGPYGLHEFMNLKTVLRPGP